MCFPSIPAHFITKGDVGLIRLEDFAEQAGCENGFEAYLDCIDAEVCGWHEACADIRSELDVCLGTSEP